MLQRASMFCASSAEDVMQQMLAVEKVVFKKGADFIKLAQDLAGGRARGKAWGNDEEVGFGSPPAVKGLLHLLWIWCALATSSRLLVALLLICLWHQVRRCLGTQA